MPNIKFSCPHCQQHIEADTGYGGMQINCPACNGGLVVPGTAPALVPVPVPASAPAPVTASGPATLRRQPSAPAQSPTASGCPSCGAALGKGAVLCTNCGYNMATGQRTVAGRPAALGRPTAPSYDVPWYKTPYPYLGAFAAILGLLYFLGRSNPPIMLGFYGLSLLYIVGAKITATVFAFKEGVGTGFLTLCIEIYTIYFVFKVSDNDLLKLIYGVAIVLGLCLRFMTP
jgi:hypothetical protein